MMGSWRYRPGDVSWQTRVPATCPMCGNKARVQSVSKSYDSTRLSTRYNNPSRYSSITEEPRHSRLTRTSDVFNLTRSSSTASVNSIRTQDIFIKLNKSLSDCDSSSYSQTSTSQNNIYEDIEEGLNDTRNETLGKASDSLYLCISEGRRNQLKRHKDVGWGEENGHEMIGEDCDNDNNVGRHNHSVKRKRLQLKRSLSRTYSTIMESLKSIF